MNSTMMLGEIGNQKACDADQQDISSYVSIYMNITHIPTFVRAGLCLPKACTQDQYYSFGNTLQNIIDNVLAEFNEKYYFENPLTKRDTKFSIQIRRNDQYNKQWMKETEIPFFMFVTVLSIIVCMIFTFPNLIGIVRNSMFNKHYRLQREIESSTQKSKNKNERRLTADKYFFKPSNMTPTKPHQNEKQLSPSEQSSSPIGDVIGIRIRKDTNDYNQQGYNSPKTTKFQQSRVNMLNDLGDNPTRINSHQIDIQKLFPNVKNLMSQYTPHRMNSQTGPNLDPQAVDHNKVEIDVFDFTSQNNNPTLARLNNFDVQSVTNSEKLRRKASMSEMIENENFMRQFSIMRAFKDLTTSRMSQSERDKNIVDLDALEGFKALSMLNFVCTLTGYFVLLAPASNVYTVFSWAKSIFIAFIINNNVFAEGFILISALISTNMMLKVYAKNGKLTFRDIRNQFCGKFLRVVPLYYLMFFSVWTIFSRLSDGPFWHQYKIFYDNCETYWWTKILLIGNLHPFKTDIVYGCFNWTWFLECDIQLYFLIPIQVLIYKRSWKISILFNFMLVGLNMIFVALSTVHYGFHANILTIGNADVYSYFITKPYYRVTPHCFGVCLGFIYEHILKYRAFRDNLEKTQSKSNSLKLLVEKYPILSRIHHWHSFTMMSQTAGNALFAALLFGNYDSYNNPREWSGAISITYYTVQRLAFSIAYSLHILCIFIGNSTKINMFLGSVYLRSLGKLSFVAAMIGPIVGFYLTFSMEKSIWLSYINSVFLDFGTYFFVMIVSLVVYLCVEYPLKKVLRITILDWIVQKKQTQNEKPNNNFSGCLGGSGSNVNDRERKQPVANKFQSTLTAAAFISGNNRPRDSIDFQNSIPFHREGDFISIGDRERNYQSNKIMNNGINNNQVVQRQRKNAAFKSSLDRQVEELSSSSNGGYEANSLYDDRDNNLNISQLEQIKNKNVGLKDSIQGIIQKNMNLLYKQNDVTNIDNQGSFNINNYNFNINININKSDIIDNNDKISSDFKTNSNSSMNTINSKNNSMWRSKEYEIHSDEGREGQMIEMVRVRGANTQQQKKSSTTKNTKNHDENQVFNYPKQQSSDLKNRKDTDQVLIPNDN
eukprot:403367660